MICNLCSREACQIASTGKCLEGFDPANTCPYLSGTAATGGEEVSTETPAFVELPRGEALTEDQASEVTRQGLTRLVVIAGPFGSGKTTILTSLFEAFLDAPFGSFLFAGSRTLVGFERRCHDARIASGRETPHTVVTRVEALDFLHLRLVSAGPSILGIQNLLLSDISGERFRSLRDSTEAVQKMKMLRRADHFCIMLDGKKLADANERHWVRTDARALLRSLIEAEALSRDCVIEVVFSKWDLVLAYPEQESLKSFIADTRDAVQSTVGKFSTVHFFEIAARPENMTVPFAFGLPTLLRFWLSDPPFPGRAKLYMPGTDQETREATRFAKSVVEEQRLGDFYDINWV